MDVKKAIMSVLSGNIVAQGAVALLGLFLIRAMSEVNYAQFTLFQSLMFLTTGFLISPFNRIIIIEKGNENITANRLNAIQLILFGVFSLYGYFYLSRDILLYGLFLVAGVAVIYFEFLKGIFQRECQFSAYRKIVSVRAVIYVVFFVLLYWLLKGTLNTLLCAIFAAIASWIVTVIAFSKVRGINISPVSPSRQTTHYLVSRHALLFVYIAFSALLVQQGVIFLRLMSSSEHISTYGSAFQYYTFLMLVMASVKQVILPMIVTANSPGLRDLTLKLLPVIIPYCGLIAILILTSHYWVSFIDAGKYPDAPLVFSILAVSSVFSLLLSPASEFLQAAGEYRYMIVALFLSIALNAVMNTILVGEYGAVGASVSTLAAFFLLNGLFALRVYSNTKKSVLATQNEN